MNHVFSQKNTKYALVVVFAMLAIMMTMVCALAADGVLPDYDAADVGSNTFAGMGVTLVQLFNSAAKMLRSFVIPLASVAALGAIVISFLPGMSTKVVEKCKTVIWTSIAFIIVAASLGGIFKLAASVGSNINASVPTVSVPAAPVS